MQYIGPKSRLRFRGSNPKVVALKANVNKHREFSRSRPNQALESPRKFRGGGLVFENHFLRSANKLDSWTGLWNLAIPRLSACFWTDVINWLVQKRVWGSEADIERKMRECYAKVRLRSIFLLFIGRFRSVANSFTERKRFCRLLHYSDDSNLILIDVVLWIYQRIIAVRWRPLGYFLAPVKCYSQIWQSWTEVFKLTVESSGFLPTFGDVRCAANAIRFLSEFLS